MKLIAFDDKIECLTVYINNTLVGELRDFVVNRLGLSATPYLGYVKIDKNPRFEEEDVPMLESLITAWATTKNLGALSKLLRDLDNISKMIEEINNEVSSTKEK